MEETRAIVKKLHLRDFAVRDPAAMQLYGSAPWMVDVDAAKKLFSRQSPSAGSWVLFWAACEERVELINLRDRGVV